MSKLNAEVWDDRKYEVLTTLSELLVHEVEQLLGRPLTADEALTRFAAKNARLVATLDSLEMVIVARTFASIRERFDDAKGPLIVVRFPADGCPIVEHAHIPEIEVITAHVTSSEPGARVEIVDLTSPAGRPN